MSNDAESKIVQIRNRLRQWPVRQPQGPRRRPPAWWPLFALIVVAGILYGAAVLRHDDIDEFDARAPAGSGNARFSLCRRANQQNCVVDGDTIHFGGEVIRIADINTPEVRDAKCEAETALGRKATQRLVALLNEGPFDLEYAGRRDTDKYGRDLRIVSRNGRSLGDILVSEGLAERWTGHKRDWCNR
jgi:endonuclease YncB( thermonuclease family)